MLKIKDKDFLEYQFRKRKEYKDLLSFINTPHDLSIVVKKLRLGIQDVFFEQRKINISSSVLEDILKKLIEEEEKNIDMYINTCNSKADLVEKVGE